MQPKSQFSSGNSRQKASAPRSPAAQFKELNYSAQAMQPCSPRVSSAQIIQPYQLRLFNPSSSGYSAISAQFKELNYSAKAMQPCSPRVSSAQVIPPKRPQSPGAQQLSLKSSTTQLRPCIYAAQESVQLRQFSSKGISAQDPNNSI